jgi:glycosyltransferase involved in cell wall biosynthesis
MRVSVTTEQRFERTPDGAVWTSGALPYTFWKRYLRVFDEVNVVARIRDAEARNPGWLRADGSGVGVSAVPYYIGAAGFVRRAVSIRRALRSSVRRSDAVILRASSPIAGALRGALQKERPFGLEVIGDPWEALGAIQHPLGPLLRRCFRIQLRRECRSACAVAYVTRSTLQQRYRPGEDAFATHYSSIELGEEAFADAPRVYARGLDAARVVSVGAMEQLYKGFDVLIDAIAIARQRGRQVTLTLVGDGRHRPELERRATARGVAQSVTFTGALASGSQVREELDRADVFVLASRTEGLPRAMIEAMARALPCIGSAVGGIVELLDAEDLVPGGDAFALAKKLAEVIGSPERLRRMSALNLERARAYSDSELDARRAEFFLYLRRATEKWLKSTSGSPLASR